MSGLRANEEVPTEGKDDSAKQAPGPRCPLRAQPREHTSTSEPDVQDNYQGHCPGDRHHERKPRRRVEERRLRIGHERLAREEVRVPQGKTAFADRDPHIAKPVEEHVREVIARENPIRGQPQRIPVEDHA